MIIYYIAKIQLKKLPINSDTINIYLDIFNSGKFTIPYFLENEMYHFWDKYKIQYKMIRK